MVDASFEIDEGGNVVQTYPEPAPPQPDAGELPQLEPQQPQLSPEDVQAAIAAYEDAQSRLVDREAELDALREELRAYRARPEPIDAETAAALYNADPLTQRLYQDLQALRQEKREAEYAAEQQRVASEAEERLVGAFTSIAQAAESAHIPIPDPEGFFTWADRHPLHRAALAEVAREGVPDAYRYQAVNAAIVEYMAATGQLAAFDAATAALNGGNPQPYVPPGSPRSGPRAQMVVPVGPGEIPFNPQDNIDARLTPDMDPARMPGESPDMHRQRLAAWRKKYHFSFSNLPEGTIISSS